MDPKLLEPYSKDQREALEQGADLGVDFITLAAEDGGTKLSPPFEILRVGEYKKGGRDISVTEADLDQAVLNFNRWKAQNTEVPVDYDHSFAEGFGSRAAGWIRELVRQGESLMARVKWTAQGAKAIRDGEFRFFSPEFHSEWEDPEGNPEGFTVLAGALTNRPFLRGVPVALSQDVTEAGFEALAESFREVTDKLAEVGGGGDETLDVPDKLTVEIDGEAQEFTAEQVAELVAKSNEDGGEAESFTVEIDGESKTFSADEVKELHDKAARTSSAESQVTTLTKRVDEIEGERKTERFDQLISAKRGEGRLDASEETATAWRETFDAIGAEKTEALMDKTPKGTIPVDERGRGTDAGPPAARGVDAGRHAMDQKIRARAEEKNIDYVEAMDQLVAAGEIS